MVDYSESYELSHTSGYDAETKKKLWWEVRVSDDRVQVIQRGGPLEPVVLDIKGKDIEVDDWWGWGRG